MSTESTEDLRRAMLRDGVPDADLAQAVEAEEPTWDTEALERDFEVLGFSAPFVVAKRRSDGVRGSLEFTHRPRVYFNFKPVGDGEDGYG